MRCKNGNSVELLSRREAAHVDNWLTSTVVSYVPWVLVGEIGRPEMVEIRRGTQFDGFGPATATRQETAVSHPAGRCF
jgi:hypothetical protein